MRINTSWNRTLNAHGRTPSLNAENGSDCRRFGREVAIRNMANRHFLSAEKQNIRILELKPLTLCDLPNGQPVPTPADRTRCGYACSYSIPDAPRARSET